MKESKRLAKDTRLIIVFFVAMIVSFSLWQFIRPWIAEYYYRNGYVANTYNKFKESAVYLDKTLKLAPWETYYLITQVKNYESLSQMTSDIKEKVRYLKMAKDLYDYMLKINPTNPWYYNGLASIYLGLSNYSEDQVERKQYYEDAGKAYEQAAKIDYLNPLFQMSLAYYYHRIGRVSEAYALYQKCVELDDWFVEAYYNMAEMDLSAGNIDKAIENFEKIATADVQCYAPSNKTYKNWVKGGNYKHYREKLGEIYLSQNKFDLAIKYFEWALENNKEDPKLWRSLGVSYHQARQLERAIYAYKQAISIDPELYDIYKYLGYVYYNVGLLNGSVENLKKYLKVTPSDKKAQNDLSKIQSILNSSGR